MRTRNNWIPACFFLFFAGIFLMILTSRSSFYDSFKSTKEWSKPNSESVEKGVTKRSYSFKAVGDKTRYILVNFAKEEQIDQLQIAIISPEGKVLAAKTFTGRNQNFVKWNVEEKLETGKKYEILVSNPEKQCAEISGVKLKYHNFNTLEYYGSMGVAVILLLLIFFDWHQKRTWKTEEPKKLHIGHIMELLIHAAISFYMLEFVFENTLLFDMELIYAVHNWMFCFLIYFILLLFFNSMKVSLIGGNLFFLLWAIANEFVFLFKGQPIQPIDLLNIKTAGAVAGEYTYELTWQMMLSILYVGIVIYLTVRRKEVRIYRFGENRRWWNLIFPALGAAAAAVVVLFILNTSYISDMKMHVHFWRNQTTYNEYGIPMGFLATGKKMQVTEPEGYSKEEIEDLMTPYEEAAKTQKTSEISPHIIAIMNESFADLSYIKPDLETNIPYLSFFDSLKENTVKGHLMVSPFGGWTPNSEYEFLFGHSLEMLGASIPYSQYLRDSHDTLVSNLKSAGYTTTAFHPHKPDNWRRNSVYPNIGFDTFLSRDDFSKMEKIRNYTSDEWNYKQLIKMMEDKEEGERKFIFNVTMQNHGGYDYMGEDFTNDVHIEGQDFYETDQYLSLMKKSDEALEGLIEYFRDYREPVVIVFFGDHYPNLPDEVYDWLYGKSFSELTRKERQKKYTVPFFIWANYDIEEEENVNLSTNYLSTKLMEVIGMEKTPYQMYLTKLQKSIPQINVNGYVGSDGNHYELGQESPYSDLIKEYNMIQYNELFDKKNKVERFFQNPERSKSR